ncbi:MAG: gamma-glutamyl-gamma-aminobutyrate hydrolase family protein [Alphaproteobacteria bacterium]|nr:gamma-glutamyl-gamma-aminobutyrate hydrolase family protein [Alphaproteobacteria bacterium]
MNHSQNYISRKIYLHKDCYDCYNVPVYSLMAEEVSSVSDEEFLPEIYIDELDATDKPKIAVILAQDKHVLRQEKDFTMHPAYVEAIVNAGGYPVFFSYDKVDEVLDMYQPHAIMLIGGFFDLPPNWYVHKKEHDINKRCKAYIDALNYAKNKKTPLLGICAGMQMLGGFCGAKLNNGYKNHLIGGDVEAHSINIVPNTKLAQIAKSDKLSVNSHHSEAICKEQLGECVVSALAADGLVEAIELKDPWNEFVVGVQWHPERNFPNSSEFRNSLFKSFVDAAKNYREL